MIRPICVKCKIEMECMKNVIAVWHPIEGKHTHEIMKDTIEDEQIDFVVLGDRYKCSKCGANIVTGFGRMITAAAHDQNYLISVRDGMEEKIRILRGEDQ